MKPSQRKAELRDKERFLALSEFFNPAVPNARGPWSCQQPPLATKQFLTHTWASDFYHLSLSKLGMRIEPMPHRVAMRRSMGNA